MDNLCAALSGDLLVGRWGTRLDTRQKTGLTVSLFPHSPKIQPSESSMFSRMADKMVSSVLAEALPLIAAKMRRFSNVPAKE